MQCSYGPAGEEVILATLRYCIFYPDDKASEVLRETLSDALNTEQEHPNNAALWKDFQPTAFSLFDFMHYVAGPFVTNLLISEDQDIAEPAADLMRQKGAKYGRIVFESDDSIDDLLMKISAS
jgi:hypothetical protein